MARRKKKKKIAPRFYVFCTIIVALVVGGVYFAVKAFSDNGGKADEQNEGVKTEQDSTLSSAGIDTKEEELKTSTTSESAANVNTTILANNIDYDMEVYNAIVASEYINIIGKNKAEIVAVYGEIVRYEEWAGGIYFHKNFPETMYVGYANNFAEDGTPTNESICSAIEISLEKIKPDLVEFKVANGIWGKPIPDSTGEGWTNYYYNVNLGKGKMLFLYCNDDGSVSKDTHVFVKYADI